MIVTYLLKGFRRVLEILAEKAIGSRLHKTSLSALKSMYRRPNLTFGGKLKRVSKLVAVLAAAVLITTGCSSSSSDNAGGDVKVGLAYDVGGRGDKSFNDSAALGLDQAITEFGIEAKEVTVTTGSDSEREDKLRLLAEAGYNPIIAVGYLYATSLKAVAPDYPEINFGIVDDSSPIAPNVASLIFAEEHGSYLVGIAAALESKSGKVGYIGGVRTPLLQKFEAGFAAGVKATKSSATVDVKYIQESDYSGFNDPAKAKVIAKGMIDKGVDVIYTAAGGSGAGTFAAAIDAGTAGKKVWTIGVDSDQYLTASAAEQANMLTSMLKRVDRAVYDVIAAAVNGTSVNDVLDAAAGTNGRVYGLELDGVGVSYSGDYITKYKDQIDKAAADIKSGAIKVPSKP
jgi:basic membrane protein A